VTIAEAIQKAAVRLAAQQVPDARRNAELLLCHALGRDRAWVLVHGRDELDALSLRSFETSIDRRAAREPLQHITGFQEFWGLPFTVTRDVLIPRPETEFVVEAAAAAVSETPAPVIIDLCTGSGCIAVSLAYELPRARIFATDRSGAALDIARHNARRNGVADRIRFLEGDLFGPLDELDLTGRADVIAANPPYVRSGDLASLQPEVRDFEPELALIAGPEGTEVAERIIGAAPEYLRSGGSLIVEMGLGQAEALRKAIKTAGRYGPVEVLKDLAGIERVIIAKKE
jgi:release factor glutamine methyltransferase